MNLSSCVLLATNARARPSLRLDLIPAQHCADIVTFCVRCSCIRRSTTLLVVAGEVYFFNKRPTRRAMVSREGSCVQWLSHASPAKYLTWRIKISLTKRRGGVSRPTCCTPDLAAAPCPWQAALLLMVGGAVVAGMTDLTFNLLGYAWVSVCVVSTAVYLLLIKKLKDVTGPAPACGVVVEYCGVGRTACMCLNCRAFACWPLALRMLNG